MAFDDAPSGWFSGISASATELTIPYTALNDLNQTKAHPTTGDIREIIYNICESFSDTWANTPSADRPQRTTITTGTSISSSGGNDTITKTYTIRVTLDVDAVSVGSEPA
jgi:hypothetical protein